MRSPLPIKSDLLRPLSALNSIQHGAIGYYRELRNSADLFLQVAAWCALLDAKQLTIPDWSALLPLCTHGAVRSRAYAYFHELNERGLARQVAEAAPATHEDLDRRLMLAELDGDNADVADIHGALYLETGDLVQLEKAARSAEVAGGWRPSLLWAVRMLVASFLTKNLRQHWVTGARWFWDTLVDADLANNTQGWQWTAGSGADASPYFRIFNPVTQGERFDPDGDYVRRWVPELAAFEGKSIHKPWADPARPAILP